MSGGPTAPPQSDWQLVLPREPLSVSRARRAVTEKLERDGLGDLVAAAQLVVSELVANAVLHTDGDVTVGLRTIPGGVRLTVADRSQALPVSVVPTESSMTGRGLRLVQHMAARLGAVATADGKRVWADLVRGWAPAPAEGDPLVAWGDSPPLDPPPAARHVVELGDVPTDLLLAAKGHVDNLVRELTLAAAGAHAGMTARIPPGLAQLVEQVVHRFAEPRLAIKRQALAAAREQRPRVTLRLSLTVDAAEAGEEYLAGLDEADAYCRAARLLTLASPRTHRVFRQWYVTEIVDQLREASRGGTPHRSRSFEQCLLEEVDRLAHLHAVAERSARLAAVTSALSGARSAEAVAAAVLQEGVAALDASGGGIILATGRDRLAVPGTVGYDASLVRKLQEESPSAELPAATALRTGEAVWIESREDRDQRFPHLAGWEQGTISMCAVPLEVASRRLGALRFSFSQPKLFDEEERRFVLALAGQAAQALDRAHLVEHRTDLARRLQRSLLPPALPDVPGLDIAAVYLPMGESEIGGDFYDVWAIGADVWGFSLGDVCGTGPEAAALTALVRYTLRALAVDAADPAAVLRRLNQVLYDTSLAAGHERFCTVVFGTIRAEPLTGLDPDAARPRLGLRWATGGHPGPVLRRASGTSLVEDSTSLIGILEEVDVSVHEMTLRAGEVLVLYTDGVTEARAGGADLFGTPRLVETVAGAAPTAAGVAGALEKAVLDHAGPGRRDDLAVLAFGARREGSAPGRRAPLPVATGRGGS